MVESERRNNVVSQTEVYSQLRSKPGERVRALLTRMSIVQRIIDVYEEYIRL